MEFRHTDCSHVVMPLFNIGKAKVFGGGKEEYRYYALHHDEELGLTLCLSKFDEIKIEPINLKYGTLPDDLLAFTRPRYPGETYIGIDWPDMGIPGLPKGFWKPFVDHIKKTIHKSVYVHCAGGHGRTGTALAIMAYMAGVCENKPIKWLRDVYCKHVVESQEQIDYIGDVTGLVLNDKPAHKYITTTQSDLPASWYDWKSKSQGTTDKTPADEDQADSIIDLIDEAKGVYKMVDHDATQAELWADDSVYHGDGWYWSAWGGKLHKKYDKAVSKLKKIKRIVEKEAK